MEETIGRSDPVACLNNLFGCCSMVSFCMSHDVDDVRFDICTTQPIPAEIPGTASFGGLVEVLLSGLPTKMGDGIQIFAYARGGALYVTQTIHDSTYHFYNIPPGTYTVYAEVWFENLLYTATVEVTVVADERNHNVDLILQ